MYATIFWPTFLTLTKFASIHETSPWAISIHFKRLIGRLLRNRPSSLSFLNPQRVKPAKPSPSGMLIFQIRVFQKIANSSEIFELYCIHLLRRTTGRFRHSPSWFEYVCFLGAPLWYHLWRQLPFIPPINPFQHIIFQPLTMIHYTLYYRDPLPLSTSIMKVMQRKPKTEWSVRTWEDSTSILVSNHISNQLHLYHRVEQEVWEVRPREHQQTSCQEKRKEG